MNEKLEVLQAKYDSLNEDYEFSKDKVKYLEELRAKDREHETYLQKYADREEAFRIKFREKLKSLGYSDEQLEMDNL